MSLPHRFPFRLIDDTQGARARFALTLTSYWLREGGMLPIGLLVEAMAQAAALLLRDPGAPEGDRLLAGVEGVHCPRPLRCGDRLEIEAALEARLGGAARVSTRVYRNGEEVARGTLLLATI